jgi:hypothetical protein
MGYFALGLLLFLLVLGLGISRLVYGRDKSFSDAANTFQTVLTAAAIMLAGYWYFVERRGKPHADVTQAVSVVPIKPGFVGVESQISIKNLGETVLRINQARVKLQQISPPPSDPGILIPEKLASLGRDEWPEYAEPDATGRQLPMFSTTELQWPTIRRYRDKVNHEIEPGETDVMIATFIVTCDIKMVRVAALLRKDSGDKDEKWWRSAAFADTAKVCREQEHAKH